jgi:predicted amidohydrolase
VRVAAIQLEPAIADVTANLTSCDALADEAGAAGAQWIVLPEFFTTGMGFVPEIADAALAPDGEATELLLRLAARHGANVGGSFLCRDADGEVRNAFLLATPGGIAGRHDKDIPTLWENCFYVGGKDDGVIETGGIKVGVALCLEFGRTPTLRRLRGVDLVVGGSFTWRLPGYMPDALFAGLNQRLMEDGTQWAAPFARMVGAPVVEATHCGDLDCRDQLMPLRYRCQIGNGAKVCAADGTVLAGRSHSDGPGVVIADIEAGAGEPLDPIPDRFWIEPLGPLGETLWRAQRWHGRRWYRRHTSGAARPTEREGAPA